MAQQMYYDNISKGLDNLFQNSKYSDLAILLKDGRELKVHKAIVCSQCSFFEQACDSNMIEGKSNVIDLSQEEPEAVMAMLQYLYHSQYPTVEDQLKLHAQVYGLAEKFNIGGLKTLSHNRFLSEAKSTMTKDEDLFWEAINLVYKLPGEDNTLRGACSLLVSENVKTLKDGTMVCATLAKTPEFASDIARLLAKRLTDFTLKLELKNKSIVKLNTAVDDLKSTATLHRIAAAAAKKAFSDLDAKLKPYKCPVCAKAVMIFSAETISNLDIKCHSCNKAMKSV